MEAAALLRAVKPFNFKLRFSTATTSRGGKAYDGLLLDAGGTLLQLAKPVEEIYSTIGRKYGVESSAFDIKQGFKRAFSAPWPRKLRYQGDGKPFWKLVVSEATGCDNLDFFEEVYEYYSKGDAWRLPEGAHETMLCLKDSGVKLAVVSNFDSRLRNLLKELDVLHLFDAVIISSEVGYEKPDVEIFRAALDGISVETSRAVHVGDDTKADKEGANAAGIDCWWDFQTSYNLKSSVFANQFPVCYTIQLCTNLSIRRLWGKDVKNFSDIRNQILLQSDF